MNSKGIIAPWWKKKFKETTEEDFNIINLMMRQTPQLIQFYSLLNPKDIASGMKNGIPPRTAAMRNGPGHVFLPLKMLFFENRT